MEMSPKIKELFSKCSDLEKLKLIKDQAIKVNRFYKTMSRAADSEFNRMVPRKGKRGGLNTSLQARTENAADSYIRELSYLKYMVNEI